MKIAVITSGGDSPGMNACIRAVVRCALSQGMEVRGFYRGYQGILDDDSVLLERKSVSNIIQHGGTFLQTDRCEKFLQKEYRLKAGEVLAKHGIEGLVVIGGDGSFNGAAALSRDTGINVIGIPGTIDNDLAYTDYTLGFDTAVNNVLWAVNSLRDTMQSHNKVTFVEVMGRRCGDIALHAGLTGGAEYILVPEVPFDIKKIAEEIAQSAVRGKKSNLVVMAEGAGRMEDVCIEFEKYSGIKPRQTRLGFIQRGGSPTYRDRLLACLFGIEAVRLLAAGRTDRAVGIRGEKIIDDDIYEALKKKKIFNTTLHFDAGVLT
ncbi:MAG: 6-phosphofructokinase [Clostridia bacterium]|nr:6-phosphofructokinase [Clostridia bacterium]